MLTAALVMSPIFMKNSLIPNFEIVAKSEVALICTVCTVLVTLESTALQRT